jgi:acyl carrier protein
VITTKIHDIWSRLLGADDFSDTDDFFGLGGNSLLMTRMQRQITAELGVSVPMDQLFRRATVAALAEYVAAELATT